MCPFWSWGVRSLCFDFISAIDVTLPTIKALAERVVEGFLFEVSFLNSFDLVTNTQRQWGLRS